MLPSAFQNASCMLNGGDHMRYPSLFIVLLLLTLPASPSKAAMNQHVENFFSTQYKDTVNTTAWWDTVAGELKLHAFEITLVASYDTPTDAREVAVHGDYAFLTEYGHPGLIVFDISDPESPLFVTSLDLPEIAHRPVISGNYLYVGLAGSAGLYVVDITDPTAPSIAGSYIGLSRCRHMAVNGDYMYVAAGGGGVAVLDISNPTNPSLLGSCGGLGYVYIISVSGDYVFTTSEYYGLYIVDVSDPTNPHVIGGYPSGVSSAGHAVSGDRCYVRGGTPEFALLVLDISDPTNPVLIGSLDPPNNLGGKLVVSSDYLYAFEDISGELDLAVIDISDPSNPTIIDRYTTNFNVRFCTLFGEYLFIGAGADGLKVLKIAEPVLPPALVGGVTTPHQAHKVAIDGNYAYVADDNSGLQVVDITDPVNPIIVGGVDTPLRLASVTVDGDYVYAHDYWPGGNNYVYVIDVSNPMSPTIVGTLTTPDHISGPVAVAGDYAYIPNYNYGLRVADISDPTNPVEVAVTPTPGGYAVMAALAGNYLYLAEYYGEVVSVLNVTDPLNPIVVTSVSMPDVVRLVTVEGNYLYVACCQAGLQVVDITNPTNPVLVGGDTTPEDCFDVKVCGDYAYAADRFSGFHVYDVQDPTNPTLLHTIDTGSYPLGVAVAGDYAYVADMAGLQVIEVFQRHLNAAANKAQSLVFDDGEESIFMAKLTTTQVGSIHWELSADGGVYWEQVLPDNSWHALTYPGNDLLWRSTHLYEGGGTNPTCTDLTIEWRNYLAALQCPGDSIIPAYSTVPNLVLVGFEITNMSSCCLSFDYFLTAEGPTTLVDNGDPESLLGTTPMLAPGESYTPPEAALVIPAIRTLVHEFVTYFATTDQNPDISDSCTTTITFEPPVAILIDNFHAKALDSGVELKWNITTDEEIKGLKIYRSSGHEARKEPIDPDRLIQPNARKHIDRKTLLGQTYHYVLSVVRKDNSEVMSRVVTVKTKALVLALHQNHPNPFNPATTISFTLPQRLHVNLSVYNLEGKLVTTLVDETMEDGFEEVSWYGRDSKGNPVSSGVYFYQLKAEGKTLTKKMVLLK